MAEAAGLALGALGVVGLFGTCLDVFKLIAVGRGRDRGLEILAVKLENQKALFAMWGQSVGLDRGGKGTDSYDRRLDEPVRRDRILHTMRLVATLFLEGEALAERYGLRKASSSEMDQLGPPTGSVWKGMFQRLQGRLLLKGKKPGATEGSATRWAIVDRDRFLELVSNLRELVNDLEALTRFPDTQERRQKIVTYEIESLSDPTELELVKDAGEDRPDELSDAASSRVDAISSRAGPLSDQMTSRLSDLQTFVTAKSRFASDPPFRGFSWAPNLSQVTELSVPDYDWKRQQLLDFIAQSSSSTRHPRRDSRAPGAEQPLGLSMMLDLANATQFITLASNRFADRPELYGRFHFELQKLPHLKAEDWPAYVQEMLSILSDEPDLIDAFVEGTAGERVLDAIA